jgi:hypothetical protein
MWEFAPRRYPHGLDLKIINVDEHPFIALLPFGIGWQNLGSILITFC